MTFIKVCGLTAREQIDWAVELGYDAIGVVVAPSSKRRCPAATAIDLARHARGKLLSFVVALSYAETAGIGEHFDVIQLYEMADLPNLAYASGQPPPAGRYNYFFYDASVGSGVFQPIPDWVRDVPGKLVLAGGLDRHNVAGVIDRYRPYGVDVSSSVETAPGIKDKASMAAFIAAARGGR